MVEVLTFEVRVGSEFVPVKTGRNDSVSTVIKHLEETRHLQTLSPHDYKIYCLDPPIPVSKWNGEKGPEVKLGELLRSVIKGPFDHRSVALILQTHEEGMFGRYFCSTCIGVLTSSI